MFKRFRITAIVLVFAMVFSIMSPFARAKAASKYETKIAAAEAELTAAQTKLTELQKAAATAKTAYENAKPTVQEASLVGFLMDSKYGMGWSGALDYIEYVRQRTLYLSDSDDTQYTNIGAEGDATSLDGLLRSLELFEEGNELRVKEGVSALKVNAKCMLFVAIECNYYKAEKDHIYFIMGSNLAWCYEDPFDGWYTKEKKTNGGHYQTLIEPSFTSGGFAMIMGEGVNEKYYSHSFTTTTDDTVIMDLSTVKTKAQNYINYIKNYGSTEKTAYEKAQAAVSAQETVVAEKQAALTALKPTSISLSSSSLSITVGSSSTLTATVKPSTAYSAVTWTTSNSAVATVSSGKITGVKDGTATITATTANGKTATCTVTVQAESSTTTTVTATSVTLSKSSVSLNVGSTTTLTATVSPSTVSQSVTWSSSNTGVATVSNGTVKGIKAGSATITAKTSNGKTAECTVTVNAATSSSSSSSSNSTTSTSTKAVYRLYNPSTNEHLYTTDVNEYGTLYKKYGWGKEGVGWYAPTSGTAVYRLYQPGLGNHLYTTDLNEVNTLVSKYGWKKDNNGKPLFYSGGTVSIYRVYNKASNGLHHLTTDATEYNTLYKKYGWSKEGIAMHAVSLGKTLTKTQYSK